MMRSSDFGYGQHAPRTIGRTNIPGTVSSMKALKYGVRVPGRLGAALALVKAFNAAFAARNSTLSIENLPFSSFSPGAIDWAGWEKTHFCDPWYDILPGKFTASEYTGAPPATDWTGHVTHPTTKIWSNVASYYEANKVESFAASSFANLIQIYAFRDHASYPWPKAIQLTYEQWERNGATGNPAWKAGAVVRTMVNTKPRIHRDPPGGGGGYRFTVNPKGRDGNDKSRPGKWGRLLLGFINGVGEGTEMIDMLADAAGYDRRKRRYKKYFQKSQKKYWGINDKIAYLLRDGGLDNLDARSLLENFVQNNREDRLYGIAGGVIGEASGNAGRPVGWQTGPAI